MTNVEKSFRIWKKGETENQSARYTISVGKRGICYELPLHKAMECLAEELEGME